MNEFDLMEHLGTAVLVLGGMAVFTLYYRLINRPGGSKEYLTGHAVVVSRRLDQKSPRQKGPYMPGFSRWKYLVTFDLGSTRLELQVSEADYSRLKEGLTGQLEWQYEYLHSFTPDPD